MPLSAQNVKTSLEIVNGLLRMAVVCEDEPEEDDSPFGQPQQQYDEDEEDPFAEQRQNSDSEEADDREQKKREFNKLQAQSKQDQLQQDLEAKAHSLE